MVSQVQAWLGLQLMDDYDETLPIQNAIYRGTIDLLARTRCVARCVHLHYQANQGVYTLDHKILALVDVEDGATRRARRDQTGYNPAFATTVVYPAGVTADTPFTFTLIRSDLFRINPTPTSDGVFDVWAVLLPTQMAADSDSPSDESHGAIPEEYQDAIVLYALWQMADYGDDATGQQGERYRIQYEGQDMRGGRLREIKMLINKRGTARAPARRVSLSQTLDRSTWVG